MYDTDRLMLNCFCLSWTTLKQQLSGEKLDIWYLSAVGWAVFVLFVLVSKILIQIIRLAVKIAGYVAAADWLDM